MNTRTCHFTVHGKDLLSLVCQWTHYCGHETICVVHIITHMNLLEIKKNVRAHSRSARRIKGFLEPWPQEKAQGT